jgi:hypothetical protein
VIGGGYNEFVGFAMVHRKTIALVDEEVRPPRLVQLAEGKIRPSRPVQLPRGRSDHPGRCRQEASKQRIRVRIVRLASRLSKVAVAGHPSNGENLKTSKITLEGNVSLLI